jgi:hypothetical protein
MTYENAIKSVQDGSYRSATESDLREMLRACMDAGSASLTVVHPINHAADIIRGELADREAARLAKPHWSVVPNFWLTVIAAIGGLVAIVEVIFRWIRRR